MTRIDVVYHCRLSGHPTSFLKCTDMSIYLTSTPPVTEFSQEGNHTFLLCSDVLFA